MLLKDKASNLSLNILKTKTIYKLTLYIPYMQLSTSFKVTIPYTLDVESLKKMPFLLDFFIVKFKSKS